MKVRHLKRRSYRKTGGGPNFGLRCKDYCAGCLLCDSFRFLDENGRFPRYYDEAQAFSDQCVLAESAA